MHCWARTVFYLVVASLAAASMLGACGQKGPLYLPEDAPPTPSAPTGADVPIPVTAPTVTP
ncbi:MAG: hypothetical protein EOM91_02645 [Sphingobacteriia bacterium]|nr:hypothetical protein [Sphingobacteriia bacterium]NCC38066.1 hypothetical protein [Gammaproteobacteria bacterium]